MSGTASQKVTPLLFAEHLRNWPLATDNWPLFPWDSSSFFPRPLLTRSPRAKLRRFAGVSEAGARSRNPEQGEGSDAWVRSTYSPKLLLIRSPRAK